MGLVTLHARLPEGLEKLCCLKLVVIVTGYLTEPAVRLRTGLRGRSGSAVMANDSGLSSV